MHSKHEEFEPTQSLEEAQARAATRIRPQQLRTLVQGIAGIRSAVPQDQDVQLDNQMFVTPHLYAL